MAPPLRPVVKAALGTAAALGSYAAIIGSEVLVARKRIGTSDEVPPSADGTYGDDLPGTTLRVLFLGDSTAVGYGMTHADDTPSSMAAIGLAHLLDRPVDVRSFAVVGARSAHLLEQIERARVETDEAWESQTPELTFVLVGANDVTHSVPRALAARQLERAVRELRDVGSEVVVGTCPDLGTVKPLPQPLRALARRRSRKLARAQAAAAIRAGARVVSLGDMLDELLMHRSIELFGDDAFHPSEAGYAHMMSFLVASGAAAWRERGEVDTLAPHDDMSIDDAAHEAAEHAGTEVVPARGGRLASVLRRRR